MTHPTNSTDLLVGHAAGLRALARGLLRDEHAAEDVVQETWAHALTRHPVAGPGLGGWLRKVTRHVALKRRRGDRRRSLREQQAEHRAPPGPVDEELADREVIRQVVDAVLDLPEPYQTVVILRYYQGMSPREIARRRQAPVATVESQLHRARTRLRRRLDATGRGRSHWAPALSAFARRPGPLTLSRTSSLARGLVGSGALAALVVVGVIALGRQSTESPRHRLPSGPEIDAPVAVVPISHAPAPTLTPVRSIPFAEEAALAPVARRVAPTHAFVLRGIVVDRDDQPQRGAWVYAAPPGHPLNAVARTNGRGRFETRLRAPSRAFDVVLHSRAGTRRTGLMSWRLTTGDPHDLRLVVRRTKPLRRLERDLRALRLRERSLRRERPGARDEIASLRQKAAALARQVADHRRLPTVVGTWPHGDAGASFGWPTPATLIDEVVVEDHSESEDRDLVRLVGTITAASGAPAARCLVFLDDGWARSTRAGPDGRFSVEVVPGRTVRLRAGGGRFGIATTRLEIPKDGPREIPWNPTLDRGLEIKGTLLTAAGRGLDAWDVEAVVKHPRRVASDLSRTANGRLRFPNAIDRETTLYALGPSGLAFAHATFPGVRAGPSSSFRVSKSASRSGTVRVHLRDADGGPVTDADVRLWQVSTGRGEWMKWRATEDAYVLSGVPAGRYRVEAGTLVQGFTTADAVWVTAERSTEVGPLLLAATRRAEWSVALPLGLAPSAVRWDLVRVHAGAHSVVASDDVATPLPDPVPTGRYLLTLRGPGFVTSPKPLEVVPGRDTKVETSLRDRVPVTLRFETARRGRIELVIDDGGATGLTARSVLRTAAPRRVFLAPGRHRLSARFAGEDDETARTVTVAPGTTPTFTLDLDP